MPREGRGETATASRVTVSCRDSWKSGWFCLAVGMVELWVGSTRGLRVSTSPVCRGLLNSVYQDSPAGSGWGSHRGAEVEKRQVQSQKGPRSVGVNSETPGLNPDPQLVQMPLSPPPHQGELGSDADRGPPSPAPGKPCPCPSLPASGGAQPLLLPTAVWEASWGRI